MKVNIPFTLMQGLYYPAALGTGLVLFMLRVGAIGWESAAADVRNWFALLLLGYFSLSYVSVQRWSDRYDWKLFFLDAVEVGAVLFAFKYLGFVDSLENWRGLRGFYICMALVPALHFLWNLHLGVRDWRLRTLNGTRLIVLLVGAFFARSSLAYAWFAVTSLLALTSWYVWFMYGKRRVEVKVEGH